MDDLIQADLSRAYTLPSRFYTDSQVLSVEVRNIFRRTWQLVGAAAQVSRPGDYVTFEVAGEPLLVVRDNSSTLRGFFNVCRHRAGPPAEGCGSRKVFRCGYHGWTYSLEGRLLNAPEFEGVNDFSHDNFGLRPVAVEECFGLIFVNLSERPEDLRVSLADLPRQFSRFGFDRMRFFERRDYVMDCNWKTYIDNFLEGYHLPSVHPGLNRELDYGEYVTELFDRYSLQASPIRSPSSDVAGRRYAEAGGESAEYYWVFPNWMLNCYPDNVSINIVLPLAPERTLARFEWYFPEALLATDTPRKTVTFSDEIQIEDARICETVQRNLQSSSYDRGRYSVRQEKGVHHFHRLYARWLRQ